MLKTLCNYYKDCIKEEFKSSNFRNLTDEKIKDVNGLIFSLDDSKIVEMMTKAELNKTDRQLIYGEIFLTGEIGRDKFNTPLRYYELELKRVGSEIIGQYDEGDPVLNIGAISCLFDTDPEAIESAVNTLLDYVATDELVTVLKSLVDMKGLQIEEGRRAVILSKVPSATAGLLSELEQIKSLVWKVRNK